MKTQSSLEPLEPRVAPAGIIKVSLVGGVLTLIGDNEGNAVAVNVLGNGTVDLTPTAGTELEFGGTSTGALLNVPVNAPKVVAKLGEGNDNLVLTGSVRSVFTDLGAGNDIINFNSLTVGGQTRILGRDGNDSVLAMAPGTQRFFGSVTLDLGAGDDNATLNGLDTTIGGSFSFLGGAGADTLAFANGASISGNLSVGFGAGPGNFSAGGPFSTFRVAGKATVTGANADGEALNCALTAGTTSILGGLTFAGGNGNNLFQLQTSTKAEFAALKILGGTGLTSVFLTGPTTVGNSFFAQSSGALSILHFGFPLSVGGNLAARSGSGICTLTLGGSVSIGQNLSVSSANGGSVGMNPGVQVGKNIALNFSGSANATSIFVTGVTAGGSLSVTGGSVTDVMNFEDVKVSGRSTINGGAGNDTINIERAPVPGAPSIFAGRLTVNAGAGDDSVGIGLPGMGQILAFSRVQLLGGPGADTLSFAPNGNVLLEGSSASGFETGT